MKIVSLIILALFYLLQLPFYAAGYVFCWMSAFCFSGYSAAEKHMGYLVKLSDKRKNP